MATGALDSTLKLPARPLSIGSSGSGQESTLAREAHGRAAQLSNGAIFQALLSLGTPSLRPQGIWE